MTTLIDRRQSSGLDPSALGAGRYATLPQQQRGRGAPLNMPGRYEKHGTALFDDGWQTLEDLPPLKTTVFEETPKKIINTNDSPDISFRQSINPYRGCEHGCSYCYARPTHAYMGLSPGLDFESKLFAKTNAATLLRAELSSPNYEPMTIALVASSRNENLGTRMYSMFCVVKMRVTYKSMQLTLSPIVASMAARRRRKAGVSCARSSNQERPKPANTDNPKL